MFTRFFGSKQGNFVPLYHTQVMTVQELITLKRYDPENKIITVTDILILIS